MAQVIPFLALLPLAFAASDAITYNDNAPSCRCYAVATSNSPQYFQNHRFFDFRYVTNSSGSASGAPPPIITGDSSTGAEQTRDQDFLNSTAFTNDWNIMSWGKKVTDDSPVRMQNSPLNVYITRTNASDLGTTDQTQQSYLALRTSRANKNLQTASEVESDQKNLLHASIRVRMRLNRNASAGAVAGLFTYMDDSNESDFEILTADPTSKWRLTNQPSVSKKTGDDIPGASLAPDNLPSWKQWRTVRLDWLPKLTQWYVDDALVGSSSYSVPRKPSAFILNMWGDGGVWAGEMPVGGSAELQIQWVQMVFNTSGPRGGPGSTRSKRSDVSLVDSFESKAAPFTRLAARKEESCQVVCAIDGVQKLGFPEVRYQSTSAGSRSISQRSSMAVACGILLTCILAF